MTGILPSKNVTVKVAAKARDEKRNANKIKNILGLITPLNTLHNLIKIFHKNIFFA